MKGFLKNSGVYFDTKPTKGSNNAVTSDGIAKAIEQGGGVNRVDVTSIWVASTKSGFNDTNFAYKVIKQSNVDETYTYTISALSPLSFQATSYIRFDKLPKSVFGFDSEGVAQTNSGVVIETSTGFASTRNTEAQQSASVLIEFYDAYLSLDFASWGTSNGNQGLCIWKITTTQDLDHYFTD